MMHRRSHSVANPESLTESQVRKESVDRGKQHHDPENDDEMNEEEEDCPWIKTIILPARPSARPITGTLDFGTVDVDVKHELKMRITSPTGTALKLWFRGELIHNFEADRVARILPDGAQELTFHWTPSNSMCLKVFFEILTEKQHVVRINVTGTSVHPTEKPKQLNWLRRRTGLMRYNTFSGKDKQRDNPLAKGKEKRSTKVK